jgi:hypothetical protein
MNGSGGDIPSKPATAAAEGKDEEEVGMISTSFVNSASWITDGDAFAGDSMEATGKLSKWQQGHGVLVIARAKVTLVQISAYLVTYFFGLL